MIINRYDKHNLLWPAEHESCSRRWTQDFQDSFYNLNFLKNIGINLTLELNKKIYKCTVITGNLLKNSVSDSHFDTDPDIYADPDREKRRIRILLNALIIISLPIDNGSSMPLSIKASYSAFLLPCDEATSRIAGGNVQTCRCICR